MRRTFGLILTLSALSALLIATACVPSRSRSDEGGGGSGSGINTPGIGAQPPIDNEVAVNTPGGGSQPSAGGDVTINTPAEGGSGIVGGGGASCESVCSKVIECGFDEGLSQSDCVAQCTMIPPEVLGCFTPNIDCFGIAQCVQDAVSNNNIDMNNQVDDPPQPVDGGGTNTRTSGCDGACTMLEECGMGRSECETQICETFDASVLDCVAFMDSCDQVESCFLQ